MATVTRETGARAAQPLSSGARRLLALASIEATPARVLADPAPLGLLPVQTRVYIPSLPGDKFSEVEKACVRLLALGLVPVPHIAARSLATHAQLAERLLALSRLGVDSLLLVAGDRDDPAGPFTDTLAVLDSRLLVESGFRDLRFAGHPEGHRIASAAALQEALWAKLDYARRHGCEIHLVSQFCYSSSTVVNWLQELHLSVGDIPVHIGIAGPSKLSTLLRYAVRCGVKSSVRYARNQPRNILQLLDRWSPAPMLNEIAAHVQAGDIPNLAGIHLYPFGGTADTIHWVEEQRHAY